jgi:hypothetical protein
MKLRSNFLSRNIASNIVLTSWIGWWISLIIFVKSVSKVASYDESSGLSFCLIILIKIISKKFAYFKGPMNSCMFELLLEISFFSRSLDKYYFFSEFINSSKIYILVFSSAYAFLQNSNILSFLWSISILNSSLVFYFLG